MISMPLSTAPFLESSWYHGSDESAFKKNNILYLKIFILHVSKPLMLGIHFEYTSPSFSLFTRCDIQGDDFISVTTTLNEKLIKGISVAFVTAVATLIASYDDMADRIIHKSLTPEEDLASKQSVHGWILAHIEDIKKNDDEKKAELRKLITYADNEWSF